jgi:hypothetical protein
VAEAKEVVHAALVDVELEARRAAQAADLGGEGEAAALLGHKQGLDTEGIAREAERSALSVPNGRGIHPFDSRPRIVSPANERCEQGFDIAPRCEAISTQLAPKFEVIDDLAIADDCEASIGTDHRLVPAGDVDNAEATHAKAEVAIDQDA